jgi:hypothetical protein
MSLINKLPLIALIRTTRAVSACTLFPNHAVIAIAASELISYTIPFINNSPLYAFNNMILFMFYMIYYNESANNVINKFLIKDYNYYLTELIIISIYLFLHLK